MTSITTPRLALALAVVGAAALPAAAQAGTVTSAKLDWAQVNVFNTMAPANTERTWLGYTTQLSAGTVSPIAPATGDTVLPGAGSATGLNAVFTNTFVNGAGSYDPSNGTGTIQLDGGIDFTGVAPASFDITVEKPKLVLDGFNGQLFAQGKRSPSPSVPNDPTTYDASKPVFNLDLSTATVTLRADGSRVISGIVPSIATATYAFPANYGAGAGPNRTPNTFGSFSLTVKTNGGDQGPKGDTGATGATGATGPAGKNGTSATVRTVKAVLAKAPYKGSSTRKVTVYSATNKKLATGTLKGRVLKVTLADKVTSLSGKVKVKVTGAKTSKTVSIPS